jgi:hypothetical protein
MAKEMACNLYEKESVGMIICEGKLPKIDFTVLYAGNKARKSEDNDHPGQKSPHPALRFTKTTSSWHRLTTPSPFSSNLPPSLEQRGGTG